MAKKKRHMMTQAAMPMPGPGGWAPGLAAVQAAMPWQNMMPPRLFGATGRPPQTRAASRTKKRRPKASR